MLHVNPKVRGQHPRLLERRPGSPLLSCRWSSTNVEIAYCQRGMGVDAEGSPMDTWLVRIVGGTVAGSAK
eukprot:7215740-Prymnesium_polylepis.1